MTQARRTIMRLLIAIVALIAIVLPTGLCAPPTAVANDEVGIPVFAYYYIWFTPTSWERAKSDLPLLGRYSSDQESVLESHVEKAREAGLDGFLVSWKRTPDLTRRLAQLVNVARAHDFKLGIVYQGLDFYRRPLPAPSLSGCVETPRSPGKPVRARQETVS